MANLYKDIQVTVTDRVARLVLARPPLNVLTIAMAKEIVEAVNKIAFMNDVCAIAFSAAPGSKMFSAGVSIEEHRPDRAFQMLESFHGIFQALNSASRPVIALVTGGALGGGCELVAFSDIVVTTPTARFGQPEIKLGVFPPAACVLLPRVIGEKKAREMILTGELMNAELARYYGLVSHIVSEEDMEKKAQEIFNTLRQLSVPALTTSRRALVESSGLSFDKAMERAEDIYLNQLMKHKDPVEGIEAFIEKRPPRWKHK